MINKISHKQEIRSNISFIIHNMDMDMVNRPVNNLAVKIIVKHTERIHIRHKIRSNHHSINKIPPHQIQTRIIINSAKCSNHLNSSKNT